MEAYITMCDVQILNCLASIHQAPMSQESPADLLLSLRHSSDLEGKTHNECLEYLSELISDVRGGYGLTCPRTDMLLKVDKLNQLRAENAPEYLLKAAVDTVHRCLIRYQLELTQLDVPGTFSFPSPTHSTPIKRLHSPRYKEVVFTKRLINATFLYSYWTNSPASPAAKRRCQETDSGTFSYS